MKERNQEQEGKEQQLISSSSSYNNSCNNSCRVAAASIAVAIYPIPSSFFSSLPSFLVQPSRVKISLLDSHHYHSGGGSGSGNSGQGHLASDQPAAMSAGRAYQVQCAAEGAKPNKPTITWWIGTKQVRKKIGSKEDEIRKTMNVCPETCWKSRTLFLCFFWWADSSGAHPRFIIETVKHTFLPDLSPYTHYT